MKPGLLYITILLLLPLVGACGFNGGGGGGGNTTFSDETTTPTYNRNDPGYVGPSQSQEQQCPGITFSTQFIQTCANTLGQYSDELETVCARALQGVYNQQCNGLVNRIRGAMSACRGDFQASFSYLPGPCQQTIQQAM